MWPFKWKLLRSTFMWCCLLLTILQNENLIHDFFFSVLNLALLEVKGLTWASPHYSAVTPLIYFSTHLQTAQHRNTEDMVQSHPTSLWLLKTAPQSTVQWKPVSLCQNNVCPGLGARSWCSSFSLTLCCQSNLYHNQGLESLWLVSGQLDFWRDKNVPS